MEEERRRKKKSSREREMSCSGRGVARRKKEKEKGLSEITKMPPFYFVFVPNCSILDTASLVHNPNSKPKIDNRALHRLLVPKNIEVRFNNIKQLLRSTT